MKLFVFAFNILCFSINQVNATQVYNIYSKEELRSAKAAYSDNIHAMLFEDLAAYLNQDELKTLNRVTLLQPSKRMIDPFEFSADASNGKILVPTFSVKFLDDLSVAMAWYEKNGCDRSTLNDYVIALDQNTLPLPSPLIALKIPENIYDQDPYVKDIAQKTLKDTVAFLLLHELGHIHYQHKSYDQITSLEAQKQESEADKFALNVYQRMHSPPFGVVFWFTLVAFRDPTVSDSPNQTHPLTSHRIRLIADQLKNKPSAFISLENRNSLTKSKVLLLANQLDVIASIIDQPNFREFLIYRGKNITKQLLEQGCAVDREEQWMERLKKLMQ
jgi:hypothetical protein